MGFGCLLAMQAASAVSIITGTITEIDTTSSLGGAPGNGDLRVFLGGTTFCPGTSDGSWGFVNANDANYKGVLATVLFAYGTGKQVTVYTRPGPIVGAGTYCQITWVQVHG